MKLNADEQQMLEGKHGVAKQKATELLVKYGEALGAETFVDTNNVHVLCGFHPFPEAVMSRDADEIASLFLLDSDEKVVVDRVKTFNTTHCWAVDLDKWEAQGAPRNLHELMEVIRGYCKRVGLNLTATCTPYQVGNLPFKGEHCAWTESSAVPFANAVLGARTNTEGSISSFAIALTGKVPNAGLHLDEKRLGTHVFKVGIDLDTVFEWNLLGYYAGETAQLGVPVFDLVVKRVPNIGMVKALNAAGASSGGIEMYHIPGVTPEARDVKEALGGNKPQVVLEYGRTQRKETYEKLNSARDENVQVVILGCPHYSLEELQKVARLLEGKKVHDNVTLQIWTANQLRTLADRNGYTDFITKAGGGLFADACPLTTNIFPEGTKTVAVDSAKQAHYIPGVAGYDVWFGTMEECIECATTGKWKGELK
jgi:hypothetical protein